MNNLKCFTIDFTIEGEWRRWLPHDWEDVLICFLSPCLHILIQETAWHFVIIFAGNKSQSFEIVDLVSEILDSASVIFYLDNIFLFVPFEACKKSLDIKKQGSKYFSNMFNSCADNSENRFSKKNVP